MIREATYDDINEVIDLIHQFYDESLKEYNLLIDDETIAFTIKGYIDNHIGLVLEENGVVEGVIGGIVSVSGFNKDELIGQEAIWYVSKSYRGGMKAFRLLKAFESECKSRGCSRVIMVHMENINKDILNKYYINQGYSLMESHYIKEI